MVWYIAHIFAHTTRHSVQHGINGQIWLRMGVNFLCYTKRSRRKCPRLFENCIVTKFSTTNCICDHSRHTPIFAFFFRGEMRPISKNGQINVHFSKAAILWAENPCTLQFQEFVAWNSRKKGRLPREGGARWWCERKRRQEGNGNVSEKSRKECVCGMYFFVFFFTVQSWRN